MAYCRFENTARDLQDCVDALDDGASPESLSADEGRALRRLIGLCREVVDNYSDVADES